MDIPRSTFRRVFVFFILSFSHKGYNIFSSEKLTIGVKRYAITKPTPTGVKADVRLLKFVANSRQLKIRYTNKIPDANTEKMVMPHLK